MGKSLIENADTSNENNSKKLLGLNPQGSKEKIICFGKKVSNIKNMDEDILNGQRPINKIKYINQTKNRQRMDKIEQSKS